jgi:AcrR family transcriptional regulator
MPYRQTQAVEARLLDKREKILHAAKTLVGEGGWAQAQVASIAAVAGMATGNVYRYFPSKAELFSEVLSKVSQREVDVIGEISDAEGSQFSRLHLAVTTFVKRAMRNPRLAYALIAEPCDKEIDEARLTYRAAISQVIQSIVVAGQSNGEFRADIKPDIAATVIVGGFMEGLIGPLSPLNRPQSEDTQEYRSEVAALADQIAELVCASIPNSAQNHHQKIHSFTRKSK